MATGSKGIVYGGANRGQATVLGPAPTTMDIIRLKQQKKAGEKADLKAKQDKDIKDLDEMMKYNPDAPWNPAYNEIQSDIENYQTEIGKIYASGTLNRDQKQQALEAQQRIDSKINKSSGHKESLNNWYKGSKLIEKEQGFDRGRAFSNIKANYEGKSVEEWGEDQFDASLDDADNYNTNKLMTFFTDNVADNVNTILSKSGVMDVTTTNTAKNFVELAPDGSIEKDEDGNPILNVSNELLAEAKSNRGVNAKINQLMEANSDNENYEETDALEELIKSHAGAKVKKSQKTNQARTYAFKKSWDNGQKDESANIFLKPMIAVLQGQESYWRGTPVTMDGKTYATTNVPLATNEIGVTKNGKKMIIKRILKDNDTGEIFYEDNSNAGLQPFNPALITRVINSSKMSSAQKDHVAKYLGQRTDERGNLVLDAFGVEKGEHKLTTKQVFESEKKKLIKDAGSYGSIDTLVEGMNDWVSKYAKSVTVEGEDLINLSFEKDEDFGPNEARLVGFNKDGDKVEVKKFDDIEHDKPNEVIDVLRKLNFKESKEEGSKEKINW